MKRQRQKGPESVNCSGGFTAGEAGVTKCVTQAAVSVCLVEARVVKTPWCDDVAAGVKFFECVRNHETRRVNQLESGRFACCGALKRQQEGHKSYSMEVALSAIFDP